MSCSRESEASQGNIFLYRGLGDSKTPKVPRRNWRHLESVLALCCWAVLVIWTLLLDQQTTLELKSPLKSWTTLWPLNPLWTWHNYFEERKSVRHVFSICSLSAGLVLMFWSKWENACMNLERWQQDLRY